MQIPLTFTYQSSGSSDCLLASLVTVLSWFWENETIENLLQNRVITFTRDLSISFITLQQIWIIALEKWYRVTLEIGNPNLFSLSDFSNPIDLIERIDTIKSSIVNQPQSIIALNFLREFVLKWWKIEASIPTTRSIELSLIDNITPIWLGTTRFFYDQISKFDFHATVIYGHDDNSFFIFDPIEWEKIIPKELYLFWLAASSFPDYDNGWILKITQ